MATLAHLIRYESPHSGLAFRESLYRKGEDAEVVADCLALVNRVNRVRCALRYESHLQLRRKELGRERSRERAVIMPG